MKIHREEAAFWAVLVVIAVLCALCASCAASTQTGPLCTSPCGVRLYGPIPEPQPENQGMPGWTCPELARAERISIDAFDQEVSDPRFANACAALRGWALQVEPTSIWKSPEHVTLDNPNGLIAGVTYCAGGAMRVGNNPPLLSALPHEMAHAIQRCDPNGHAGWSDNGIYAAIARARDVSHADRARCFDAGVYVGPVDGGVCQ